MIPSQRSNKLLDRPLSRFPSLWGDLEDEFFPSLQQFALPGVKIYEENNQLNVEVPLPGLNLNDIEVSLNKGFLWIRGESKEEEKDKKRRFYRSASRSYSFSLPLPIQIDEQQEPTASYTDGILKISFELSRQDTSKKIPVHAGSQQKSFSRENKQESSTRANKQENSSRTAKQQDSSKSWRNK